MAAPKGNKFALGQNGGRPPLFSSPEQLAVKIQEYIDQSLTRVEKDEEDDEGKIVYGYPVTITGLAYFLGFESRQSFYDYEEREEFSYVIKRARLFVESQYEQNLYSKNPTGSIFALKNMGWTDKVENRNENYNMNVEPTPEEAQRIKDALLKSI